MKIAMIFPYAPSYREPIYRILDNRLDIDWYFAANCKPNLKLLDYSILKNVYLSLVEKKFGPYSMLKGLNFDILQKYDVIVIPGVSRCITDIRLMKWNKRKRHPKIFLWTHGWYGKESWLKKIIKKYYHKDVDGFFIYGNRAQRLMVKEGYPAPKLFTIHNSLDYEKQLLLRNSTNTSNIFTERFKNQNPTLIFIGRLTKVKRLNILLDAVKILKTCGECYNLVFVGDGSERRHLEEIVRIFDMETQVWFYGECYDEERNAELIFNADLCVSPGNVGLTSIHCLMFGCPVISNDNYDTQMPEFEVIKSGITGDFFKAFDSENLAEKISCWFRTHSAERSDVREHCYAVIDQEWNPEYQFKVFTAGIKSVIGTHNACIR